MSKICVFSNAENFTGVPTDHLTIQPRKLMFANSMGVKLWLQRARRVLAITGTKELKVNTDKEKKIV